MHFDHFHAAIQLSYLSFAHSKALEPAPPHFMRHVPSKHKDTAAGCMVRSGVMGATNGAAYAAWLQELHSGRQGRGRAWLTGRLHL
eukprot:scaffold123335_cov15-Tisochrysis_lutea.AAC.1